MTVGQPHFLGHSDLADQLGRTETEDELLRAVLHQIEEHTAVDWAGVYLIDEKNKAIVLNPGYVLVRDADANSNFATRGIELREVRWKNGVVGAVARSKQCLLLTQKEADELAKDLRHDFGISRSVLVLPMVARGQCLCVLAAGNRHIEHRSDDIAWFCLISGVAAANLMRQMAERDRGIPNRAINKLLQGLADSEKLLQGFRESYRQAEFLPSLCRLPLALIRAEGCLVLTYDVSTDGLWQEGCYSSERRGESKDDISDHSFVDLIRYLRSRSKPFCEPDLSAEGAGPLTRLEFATRFLSAVVAPVTLFAGRKSFLVLFSLSRHGFGSLELSILTLVQQILEVLAAAHDTRATVDYIQRTAVMAHYIAGTTHELRNFVTYTAHELGYIQKTLTRLASQPSPTDLAERLSQLATDAADAMAECNKAGHHVEMLRHFRRKGQVKLLVQEFLLTELLDDVCRLNQDLADAKEIQIEAEYDPRVPPIESDPLLIRECVGNLLLNSIYFTGRRRRIVIGSQYQPADSLPVRISIYDEGGGIHTSELQNIFEPFYSTKESGNTEDQSGTGLGLFLTRNNLNLLGGTILAESVVPRWTRFTIQIPLKYSAKGKLDGKLSPV